LKESSISYDSPYGKIVSEWKLTDKMIVYNIQIPANATATFYPPDNVRSSDIVQLEAGKHRLELELK
jgi:alpha-L-rhamnosidase